MRIKQKKLSGYVPDRVYTRYISNAKCTIEVYSQPQLCVNVIKEITNKHTVKTERHCYPINELQYRYYMYGMRRRTATEAVKLKQKCEREYNDKPDMQVFYDNAKLGAGFGFIKKERG